MAKRKKTTEAESHDDSYLDYLGIGGDQGEAQEAGEKKGSEDDRVAELLKTVDSLTTRIDDMAMTAGRRNYTPAQAPATPVEPTLKEVSLDGLPDQQEHPAEYAKGLNARISATMQENMRVLSTHQAEVNAAASHTAGRSEQLWDDFKSDFLPKLEVGLPDDIDATPYVEVIARNLAQKAQRRGQDLNGYMYGGSFMEDVYAAADKVLAPFRVSEEGEGEGEGEGGTDTAGPTVKEVEAHRTGGIIGPGGTKTARAKPQEDKSNLITDLQEVQTASGFF